MTSVIASLHTPWFLDVMMLVEEPVVRCCLFWSLSLVLLERDLCMIPDTTQGLQLLPEQGHRITPVAPFELSWPYSSNPCNAQRAF